MSLPVAIKIACLVVIGLPNLIAATQGFTLSPIGNLAVAVAVLAAGLILSELTPSLKRSALPKTSPRLSRDASKSDHA